MKKKKSDELDMFSGFWKYMGTLAVILIGVVLTIWGMTIFASGDYHRAVIDYGLVGYFLLAPLIVGLAMFYMGMSEFLGLSKS